VRVTQGVAGEKHAPPTNENASRMGPSVEQACRKYSALRTRPRQENFELPLEGVLKGADGNSMNPSVHFNTA